jgi:hypothetical protein
MSFFGSELGVAIAWICGVAGFIFGFFQNISNKNLKIELKNSLNTSTSNSMDIGNEKINQTGNKNIYTKKNTGGMNIKM